MNRKLIIRMLGALLLIEAAAMAPSLVVALVYREGDAAAVLQYDHKPPRGFSHVLYT